MPSGGRFHARQPCLHPPRPRSPSLWTRWTHQPHSWIYNLDMCCSFHLRFLSPAQIRIYSSRFSLHVLPLLTLPEFPRQREWSALWVSVCITGLGTAHIPTYFRTVLATQQGLRNFCWRSRWTRQYSSMHCPMTSLFIISSTGEVSKVSLVNFIEQKRNWWSKRVHGLLEVPIYLCSVFSHRDSTYPYS